MNIRDIWTTVLPLSALLFLHHFIERQCLKWQHLDPVGMLREGVCMDSGAVARFLVFVVPLFCWTSHLGILRVYRGNGEHPWGLTLVHSFSEESVFLFRLSFIRLDRKELGLDSLYHHFQRSRERTNSTLPYCWCWFWKLICAPLSLCLTLRMVSWGNLWVEWWVWVADLLDIILWAQFHLKMSQMGPRVRPGEWVTRCFWPILGFLREINQHTLKITRTLL